MELLWIYVFVCAFRVYLIIYICNLRYKLRNTSMKMNYILYRKTLSFYLRKIYILYLFCTKNTRPSEDIGTNLQ